MFQQLRQGTRLYILYRVGKISLKLGEVISVTAPTPIFGSNFQPNIYTPPRNVVDVKVNVDGQTIDLQKLPADNCIADFADLGMVVSTSKEAIISEINTLKATSQKVIDSIDSHKETVEICDQLVEELSPEVRKEQALNKELGNLKQEISMLKGILSEFINIKKSENNGMDGN